MVYFLITGGWRTTPGFPMVSLTGYLGSQAKDALQLQHGLMVRMVHYGFTYGKIVPVVVYVVVLPVVVLVFAPYL